MHEGRPWKRGCQSNVFVARRSPEPCIRGADRVGAEQGATQCQRYSPRARRAPLTARRVAARAPSSFTLPSALLCRCCGDSCQALEWGAAVASPPFPPRQLHRPCAGPDLRPTPIIGPEPICIFTETHEIMNGPLALVACGFAGVADRPSLTAGVISLGFAGSRVSGGSSLCRHHRCPMHIIADRSA